jgi:non-ribosomal peptide synthetase component E (peptide arylation enzyme)
VPVRYWDTAEWKTPAAGADGWYRTGDLGRIDEDGRLFVSGRLKEVVNRGGLKVSCAEVEMVLALHPSVAECAVVPAPDPVLGEAICACVVVVQQAASPAPTLDAVREFLGAHLSRQKLPDQLCVLPSLPRTPLGKLDRRALIAAVAEERLTRETLSREQRRVDQTQG